MRINSLLVVQIALESAKQQSTICFGKASIVKRDTDLKRSSYYTISDGILSAMPSYPRQHVDAPRLCV